VVLPSTDEELLERRPEWAIFRMCAELEYRIAKQRYQAMLNNDPQTIAILVEELRAMLDRVSARLGLQSNEW
jgi:hypothetical protein